MGGWCICQHVFTHISVLLLKLGLTRHKWSNLRELPGGISRDTVRNTWNWKESLSTSAPECLYHTMPSLMSCWVKEVVGEAALPSGKSCQESPGLSAGIGTSSTTSPGKSKEEFQHREQEVPLHQPRSSQSKCPPSRSFFPCSVNRQK